MQNSSVPGKGAGVASLVFGIISILTCWLGSVGATFGVVGSALNSAGLTEAKSVGIAGYLIGLVPIILGLVGLILSIASKKSAKTVGAPSGGVSTGGLITSIIGLVLSLVFFVSCIALVNSLS